MRTLQIYGTGSATANAVAQVTIPSSSRIKAVQVALDFNSITDDASVIIEFSKVPTGQIAANGAQDPFLEVRYFGNFVTSGLAQGALNQVFPVDVECRQGEIIYFHVTVGGTVTYRLNAILWF